MSGVIILSEKSLMGKHIARLENIHNLLFPVEVGFIDFNFTLVNKINICQRITLHKYVGAVPVHPVLCQVDNRLHLIVGQVFKKGHFLEQLLNGTRMHWITSFFKGGYHFISVSYCRSEEHTSELQSRFDI